MQRKQGRLHLVAGNTRSAERDDNERNCNDDNNEDYDNYDVECEHERERNDDLQRQNGGSCRRITATRRPWPCQPLNMMTLVTPTMA